MPRMSTITNPRLHILQGPTKDSTSSCMSFKTLHDTQPPSSSRSQHATITTTTTTTTSIIMEIKIPRQVVYHMVKNTIWKCGLFPDRLPVNLKAVALTSWNQITQNIPLLHSNDPSEHHFMGPQVIFKRSISANRR